MFFILKLRNNSCLPQMRNAEHCGDGGDGADAEAQTVSDGGLVVPMPSCLPFPYQERESGTVIYIF